MTNPTDRPRVPDDVDDFAVEMFRIFCALAGRQEPLGGEFEAALYDNLDELYDD